MPSSSRARGSMAVLLITLPPGARFPSGKQTVEVIPFARACSGGQTTSSGSMPSASTRRARRRALRSLPSHSSSRSSQVRPVTVISPTWRSPRRRRCSITSGTPPARNTRTVTWLCGPFGSASTSRGVARLILRQSSTVGRRSPVAWAIAGMWSRRFVDPPKAAWTTIAFSIALSVRTAASVRPSVPLVVDGSGGAAGDVEPDRLPRRGERGVRNREPEGLGDDLRGGSGSEELTAATGGRAGAAAEVGGLVERDELVRETRSQRLHGACVLAAPGRQRDPSGDDCSREVAERSDRHQHRRQALVAGADADHAPAVRQAAHEPAQHECRVVAVGQRVEHAGRALRPAVARVRDVCGERQPAEAVELHRGLANEQSDLPVAGVVAERDGRAVVGANAAERREEQELVASDLRRLPAHAGVLREAEHVAGRALLQERVRQRQSPFGPCRGRLDLEEVGAVRRLRHRPLSCSGRTRVPSRTWSRSGPAWRRRSGRSSGGRTRRPPSPRRGSAAPRPGRLPHRPRGGGAR